MLRREDSTISYILYPFCIAMLLFWPMFYQPYTPILWINAVIMDAFLVAILLFVYLMYTRSPKAAAKYGWTYIVTTFMPVYTFLEILIFNRKLKPTNW